MTEHPSIRPSTIDPFVLPPSVQGREYAAWAEQQRTLALAIAARRAERRERAAARRARRLRRAADLSHRRASAAEQRARCLASA